MPSLTTSQKVAIAVSVPLGAVVLYMFLKWAWDSDDFEQEEGEGFATSSDLIFEVKVAQAHVGAILGRGGSSIKQIEKESQTHINLKGDRDESEGEEVEAEKRTRTILVRGSRERAKHAEVLIRKVIAEQPALEKNTMDIPQRVVGRVIGKGGNTIRQLCRISGAKIKIDRDIGESNDYQICEITGTKTQIEFAKQLLREKIDEDKTFRKKERNLAKDKSTFVQLPTDGDYFGIYVSAMKNPGHFWIQKVTKDSKQLDELVEQMTVYYGDKDGGYRLRSPNVGDLCCSPFKHDQSWYRGEITDIVPDEEVQIFYLDFGDTERVPLSDVKELRRKFCELPFQTIECYLGNIKPKDGQWSHAAYDLFEKLSFCARWKVLMARIVRYDNEVPCIELVDTNGEKDVNIAVELVEQGYAVFNETTSNKESKDSKNPSTFQQSSPDSQEACADEQPITFQEMNQQFESVSFDDEIEELDDTPPFELASPETTTNGNEPRNPQEVAPLGNRTPVDEPTLSAVEHTVVSCADLSNLSTLLDLENSEMIPIESEEGDAATDVPISRSADDDLQGAPNEVTSSDTGILSPGGNTLGIQVDIENDDTTCHVPTLSSAANDIQEVPIEGSSYGEGILSSVKNTFGAQEDIDSDSPSVDAPIATRFLSEEANVMKQSLNSEEKPKLETVSGELLKNEPVEADVERVTASPDSLSKLASVAVESDCSETTGVDQEQKQTVGRSEIERSSSEYLLRRSLSNDSRAHDTFTNGGDRELTRSSSEMVVSPRRNDETDVMDGKAELSSSLSSLEHLSKGNKRKMAANFDQVSMHRKEGSEKDEGADEDDDDSLYLSAREDSDSTGFMSATGSRTNLRDSDSDVTPSGYPSDPDEDLDDLDESLLSSETNDEERLDGTLLVETFEQYADK